MNVLGTEHELAGLHGLGVVSILLKTRDLDSGDLLEDGLTGSLAKACLLSSSLFNRLTSASHSAPVSRIAVWYYNYFSLYKKQITRRSHRVEDVFHPWFCSCTAGHIFLALRTSE